MAKDYCLIWYHTVLFVYTIRFNYQINFIFLNYIILSITTQY